MDKLKLQNIFKKFDLVEESLVNELELDNESKFKGTTRFLKKFAMFLNIYKGKEQEFLMVKDLAEISSNKHENENSPVCIIFDFKKGFQEFKQSLHKDMDINYYVLELFSNCLTYIINLILNEPENVLDIYEHFLSVKEGINIFSETTIILETNGFKKAVSFFIADLMKILTGSEISTKKTNLLKICNLIRKILTEIAKSRIYRELILRQILKKMKCALSYCKVNENFDGYIASQTYVFQYFLWIMKEILNDCYYMGSNLDDRLLTEVKETLDDVKKCLENKISSMEMNLLENILSVL